MKVVYITMQFPAPSEVFASNDVRVLREEGLQIAVHGLRPAHPDHAEMRRQRGLEGVPTTHNTVRSTLRGLLEAARRPGLAVRCLAWLLRATGRRPKQLAKALVLLPRAFAIFAELEADPPDVVHLYWSHYPSLVGFLVQERLPSVVTSVSLAAYDLVREFGGTRLVAHRADVLRTQASVNVPVIARLADVPAEAVHVIYNGVDLERVREARAGVRKTPRRILCTGRLVAGKGVDEALRAVALVRRRWPEATLEVLGNGPDRTRLERLAAELGLEDAVSFRGHVAHDEVLRSAAAAEVFLLLTRHASERLPNVVKEGMACGCLCVTTPSPGIEELVEDGVTGFLVGPDDPERAAAIVNAAFAGELELPRITEAAERLVAERFAMRPNSRRFRELWDAALRSRAFVPARAPTEAAQSGWRTR